MCSSIITYTNASLGISSVKNLGMGFKFWDPQVVYPVAYIDEMFIINSLINSFRYCVQARSLTSAGLSVVKVMGLIESNLREINDD